MSSSSELARSERFRERAWAGSHRAVTRGVLCEAGCLRKMCRLRNSNVLCFHERVRSRLFRRDANLPDGIKASGDLNWQDEGLSVEGTNDSRALASQEAA